LTTSLAAARPGVAQGAQPYRADVKTLARQNADFRHVLYTGDHVQIVAMSLPPNEDIGPEVQRVEQCFFIVEGRAKTMVAGRVGSAKENDVLCVPAGVRHNIRNDGPRPLKLYTLYAPPQHPAGTVQRTKQDAQRSAPPPRPLNPPKGKASAAR
jgi:mannose-6-phosphate isomerase-like protein (cupin superfamily)